MTPKFVRYVADPDVTQIEWGSNSDPFGILDIDAVYEVENWEVHSWHTKVFLKGIDCGLGFNSVSFKEVTNEKAN